LEIIGQASVKSKRPGDTRDYRVIASSNGHLTDEEFASVFREFSVGTMSFPASSQGEKPPWVTIGPFVRSEQRRLAIIRQDWTDWQDDAGRPVAAQCCLSLPGNVLIQCVPSYVSLFASIPSQQYFISSDKQLLESPALSLNPLANEVENILQVIDKFGFDFCSYVASMLLVSPVAIIRGQELSVSDRLSFFDAVASLLPSGSRADLSVSTWMNSTNINKINLGFSAEALPNQKRIVWMESATKELPPNTLAYNYYQLLHKLWNDPELGKQHIVSELASKSSPLTFHSPQPFLADLREINREKAAYDAVIKNQGDKEEVRALLKSESKLKYSPAQLEKLLLFLLEGPDLDDVETLRENWIESLWVPACDSIKALREPVFKGDVLWALWELAAEKGWLNNLLDALLEFDETDSSLTPTLEMFYQAIKQFDYDRERVRYLLRRDVKVAYEFLLIVAERATAEEEPRQVASWLTEGKGSGKIDFALLLIALDLSEQQASVKMIEALAAVDADYIERIVKLAVTIAQYTNNYANLERLMPAVISWLLAKSSYLATQTQQWRAHLNLMRDHCSSTVELGAQLDLTSLALSEELGDDLSVFRYLKTGPAETKRYGEEFVRRLSLTQLDSQQVIQRLINKLTFGALESQETAHNDMLLIGEIIAKVDKNHVKNLLIGHVKQSIVKYPSLVEHEAFSKAIRENLFKWNKEEQLFEFLFLAFSTAILKNDGAQGMRNAPVQEVVGLYLQMLDVASSPIEERVVMCFSESGYFDDVDKIQSFIMALEEALGAQAKSLEETWKQTEALLKYLLRINSEAMRQYRELYVNFVIESLEAASETLDLVVGVLDDKQRQIIRQMLEEMRSSIPAQRFLSFRRK
jgi:hypothetical protein